MDIRTLTYFKKIVDHGSISKAAQALHMAQPPLSITLKQLEKEFNLPLIKRYRDKWEVTEAGKYLYDHATDMLAQNDLFKAKMHYLAQGEIGSLRLGVSSSCLHLVGEIVQRYTQMYPRVTVQFIQGDSETLEHKLAQNEIDFAVILAPEKTVHYESISLVKSPFSLAVPKKWKFQVMDEQAIYQAIEHYPFIALDSMEGHSMIEGIMHYLNEKNIQPKIVATCKDILIAQTLVSKEVGLSILPTIHERYAEEIQYVTLPGLNVYITPNLLYKKDVITSPICRNLIPFFENQT